MMPQGLQVWDGNGALTLDITERLTRIYGQVTTNSVNGSIYVGNLNAYGSFWSLVIPLSSVFYGYISTPVVDFSNGTMTWTYSTDPLKTKINANILYGVY